MSCRHRGGVYRREREIKRERERERETERKRFLTPQDYSVSLLVTLLHPLRGKMEC